MVKKKSIVVPSKRFDSNESFQKFIQTEKMWMYDRIYDSIYEAFKNGKHIAYVMEATIEDTMSIISINSDTTEWVSSLNLVLEWYIFLEMYEKCAQVRDLIKSIESTEPT